MTMFGGPGELSLSGSGTHEYAMWDAAYVLGSLSSVERRAYEAHLSTCPPCREAVSELDGMPALLAQLDRDVVASIDEGGNAGAVTPPRADASAVTMTPVKPIPPSAPVNLSCSPGCSRRRAAASRPRWTKSLLYKSFLPMRGDVLLPRNL